MGSSETNLEVVELKIPFWSLRPAGNIARSFPCSVMKAEILNKPKLGPWDLFNTQQFWPFHLRSL